MKLIKKIVDRYYLPMAIPAFIAGSLTFTLVLLVGTNALGTPIPVWLALLLSLVVPIFAVWGEMYYFKDDDDSED